MYYFVIHMLRFFCLPSIPYFTCNKNDPYSMIEELDDLYTMYSKKAIPDRDVHTKEAFENWHQNPITQLMFNAMRAEYLALLDEADKATPTDSATCAQVAANLGKREAIEEFLNFDLDTY